MPQKDSEQLDPEKYAVVLSSWLYKRSKSHSWQKRWCVLRRNQLAYYKDAKEYRASRVIPIEDVVSFSAIPGHHKWHFIAVTSYKVFHLRATSEENYNKWVAAMEQVVRNNESKRGETVGDGETQYLDEEEDDEDDAEDQDGMIETFAPPRITEDSIQHDMENLHFSGTDDNFTSGGASDTAVGTSNNNGSTTSLAQFKERETIPTPIPEENENEDPLQQQPFSTGYTEQETSIHGTPQRTVYFNSFSSSSPEHVIDRGYLYRLKKRYNQWKKYYIKLTNHYIYFYKNSRDFAQEKCYKRIDLDEIIDCVELDPLSRSRVYCMLIVTPRKRIRFCADSEEELTKWLVLLKTIVKTRKNERE